jgi:hypothetical protein
VKCILLVLGLSCTPTMTALSLDSLVDLKGTDLHALFVTEKLANYIDMDALFSVSYGVAVCLSIIC